MLFVYAVSKGLIVTLRVLFHCITAVVLKLGLSSWSIIGRKAGRLIYCWANIEGQANIHTHIYTYGQFSKLTFMSLDHWKPEYLDRHANSYIKTLASWWIFSL